MQYTEKNTNGKYGKQLIRLALLEVLKHSERYSQNFLEDYLTRFIRENCTIKYDTEYGLDIKWGVEILVREFYSLGNDLTLLPGCFSIQNRLFTLDQIPKENIEKSIEHVYGSIGYYFDDIIVDIINQHTPSQEPS